MSFDREKFWAQGQRYLQRGQPDKAIAEFEQIVAEDPNDLRAPLKIGDLELQRGNAAGARPHFLRVVDAYMAQGFWSKAGALLKQLAQADPSELHVQALLAEVFDKQGLAAESNQQWLLLGQLHEQAGRAAEAKEALGRIGPFEPGDVERALAWAQVAARLGLDGEIKARFTPLYQALHRAGPNRLWAQVGAQLLELEPAHASLVCTLARYHLDHKEPAEALLRLRTGFRGSPQDHDVMQLLAEAFEALGQRDKALAVWVELAAQTRRRGQIRSLERMLTEVLRLDPAHAEAKAELGRLHVAHGGGAPVVRQGVRKGVQAPERGAVAAGEVAALLVEARIFHRYRLLGRAREALARVLASFPEQAEALALDERYRQEQEHRRRPQAADPAPVAEAGLEHTAPSLSLASLQAAIEQRSAPEAPKAPAVPEGSLAAKAQPRTIVAHDLDLELDAAPATAQVKAPAARLTSSLSSTEAGLDVDALDALIAAAAPEGEQRHAERVQATLDALSASAPKEDARFAAMLEMGRAYADMDLTADAVAQFDQVKAHGPLAAEAWLMAGQAQAKRGEREAAMHSYRQGLAVPTASAEQRQRLEAAIDSETAAKAAVDGAAADR